MQTAGNELLLYILMQFKRVAALSVTYKFNIQNYYNRQFKNCQARNKGKFKAIRTAIKISDKTGVDPAFMELTAHEPKSTTKKAIYFFLILVLDLSLNHNSEHRQSLSFYQVKCYHDLKDC